MLRYAVACALLLSLSALPAISADAPKTDAPAAEVSCKDQVTAAFAKQRSAPAFSMVAQLTSANGPAEISVDYIAPDRMRQKISAPGQDAVETVLVGTRAWSRQGANWEELMPAIAQTIIAQVREAVVDPPKEVSEFDCLGKVTVDGKEYLGYRSVEHAPPPGAGPGASVRRTIYVDPKTGLPAQNVVADEAPGAVPAFKGVYTYPTDLVIEGYPGAPLAKVR
jgi:hypothetical protein